MTDRPPPVLHCANPSCSAALTIPVHIQPTPTNLFRFLASRGWTIRKTPNTREPEALCGRCTGE